MLWPGQNHSSKSLFNRALIAQSFFSEFQVHGNSQSDDVQLLKAALQQWQGGATQFSCGDGGTTLRFLLARVSRNPGFWFLQGSSRLLSRPHQDLLSGLQQLGVQVDRQSMGLVVRSEGWKNSGPVSINPQTSSQFVSALLLASWNLDFDLVIDLETKKGSYSYLRMTIEFLRQLGMEIIEEGLRITIPRGQKIAMKQYTVEPDMSSAFAVAALGLVGKGVLLADFPPRSLQPDFQFVDLLERLGAKLEWSERGLQIKSGLLKNGEFDLTNTPDLFPVLVVLLSLNSEGVSCLRGLQTLPHKESNRIAKTLELVTGMGGVAEFDGESFKVTGGRTSTPRLVFDPDQDHRMAMAAGLAMQAGVDVEILNPTVVKKSFPDFWSFVHA